MHRYEQFECNVVFGVFPWRHGGTKYATSGASSFLGKMNVNISQTMCFPVEIIGESCITRCVQFDCRSSKWMDSRNLYI